MGDRAMRNGLAIFVLVMAIIVAIVAKLKEQTVRLHKPEQPATAAEGK